MSLIPVIGVRPKSIARAEGPRRRASYRRHATRRDDEAVIKRDPKSLEDIEPELMRFDVNSAG